MEGGAAGGGSCWGGMFTCFFSPLAMWHDPGSSEGKPCPSPHPSAISGIPDPIYICLGVQPGAGYGCSSSRLSGSKGCFPPYRMSF